MIEFSAFIDWARQDFDLNVETATVGFTKNIISTFNIPVAVDKIIDGIYCDDYATLAILGGSENYGFNEEAFDEQFQIL